MYFSILHRVVVPLLRASTAWHTSSRRSNTLTGGSPVGGLPCLKAGALPKAVCHCFSSQEGYLLTWKPPKGEAALALGVCTKTLRRWESKHQLSPSFRTAGAHRRYAQEDIARLKGSTEEAVAEELKPTLTYARVSSHDQHADLKRQTQTLREHCTRELSVAEDTVISVEDVGSGVCRVVAPPLRGNTLRDCAAQLCPVAGLPLALPCAAQAVCHEVDATPMGTTKSGLPRKCTPPSE